MLKFSHYDPNLSASCDSALARMSLGDWSSGSDASKVRDVLALVALKGLLVGHLIGSVTYSTPDGGNTTASVSGDLSIPGERGDFARALVSPCVWYYQAAALTPLGEEGLIETVAPPDVGLWPIAVIVAVSVSGAAVLGWIAHETAGVVKFFKSQNTTVSEIHRLDAAVTDTVSKHVQAEQIAKAQIPFTDAERENLRALNARLAQLQGQIGEQPSGSWINQIPWYGWAVGGAAVFAIGALAVASSLSPRKAA